MAASPGDGGLDRGGGVRLFVFGLGYTALTLLRCHASGFSSIAGTVRSPGKARALASEGIRARRFGPDAEDPEILDDLAEAETVLVTIPPGEPGDPALMRFSDALACAPNIAWIGYLSTIGVYGDRGGGWVDEETPPAPGSDRSHRRLAAERDWSAFGHRAGKAVHLFRLPGIYGPGRNALVDLRDGSARRIVKPGQVFNRAHVEDIAAVIMASIARPRAGAVYNVADDEPAPPQDVVAYAALLAGLEPPPEIPFASADLSPMAASFYGENKRVSNRLIKEELQIRLRYPTYREGLKSLREAGEGPAPA
jgi:dTDP-4-dehydrorhamnose reductase